MHVIDEYVQEARTIDQHLAEIRSRARGDVNVIACDPAGSAANEQTAQQKLKFITTKNKGWWVCEVQSVS